MISEALVAAVLILLSAGIATAESWPDLPNVNGSTKIPADADAVEVYKNDTPRFGPLLRGVTRFPEVATFEQELTTGHVA